MREPSLSVDCTSLAAAGDEFRRCADGMSDAGAPLAGIGRRAVGGAGQFGGSLDDGVATFVLSWRAALDVFAASAASIGSVARQAAAVYSATDAAVAAQLCPRSLR